MCDESVNFSTLATRVLKNEYAQKIINHFLIAPTVKPCYHLHDPLMIAQRSIPEKYDTLSCAVRNGKCESKGEADRAAAGEQRGHPRRISAALSRPQKRATQHQRVGEGL